VLAVCAPLAAQAPGGNTYEVTVSVVTTSGTFAVACTCLTFEELDGNSVACLRSATGLMALWGFSNLDLDPGVTEVQATTGVALPSICGGRRGAGFEGIALHGTVDGDTIDLEAITELQPNLRLLSGFENPSCSLDTCTIVQDP
jgi:hypothetical protein